MTAVGGIIALARRFPSLMDAQRRHAWEPISDHEGRAPPELAGQTALVVVSPHSASRSSGNYDRVAEIFLDNLARWRNQRQLRNRAAP